MELVTMYELHRNLVKAQKELYSSEEFINASDETKLVYLRVLGVVLKALDRTESRRIRMPNETKLTQDQMAMVRDIIKTSCNSLTETMFARDDVVKEYMRIVLQNLDEHVANDQEELYYIIDSVLNELDVDR